MQPGIRESKNVKNIFPNEYVGYIAQYKQSTFNLKMKLNI